ncbi:MAG: hypothetical protein ONB30_06440 [candidate division KSB1 bacterium]|nr:hypothetical protein [candidate division KSB1 bacterium]MDZ7393736.1 hypothetical protein [candidate division KSB1 bacterium]
MVLRLLLTGLVLACVASGVWGKGGEAALWESTRATGDVQLRTVVLRSDGNQASAMSIMVVHSERFAAIAREAMGTEVTPLILSVSALAPQGVYFDPDRIRVAQDGRQWKPVVVGEERDVFSLDGQHAVGGLLAGNEVRRVVLLLPEWIDVTRPMVFIYGSSARTLRFPSKESSIATRQ